jgi:hypothetical protein
MARKMDFQFLFASSVFSSLTSLLRLLAEDGLDHLSTNNCLPKFPKFSRMAWTRAPQGEGEGEE